MDFMTKYYRPNLAKGTAGAAKTTPTPIRRSAAKWAMPIEPGGGSGVIATMEVGITGNGSSFIAEMTPEYNPGVKAYTLTSEEAGGVVAVMTLNGTPTITAETSKKSIEIMEESGMFIAMVPAGAMKEYFSTETIGGKDYYTGVLSIHAAEDGGETVTYNVTVKCAVDGGGPK